MTKRRNMWPFSTKRSAPAPKRKSARRSGLTVTAASREAKSAGYRGVDFNEWLERKGLADRGGPVLSRLGAAYRAGIDQRDKAEQDRAEEGNRRFVAKLKAREGKERRARAAEERRDAAEDRRQKTRRTVPVAAETKAEKAAAKYDLDTGKLAAHYARGGTLTEFLRSNPCKRRNAGDYSYHGVTTDSATAAAWKAKADKGICPWCGKSIAKKYSNVNKHLRSCPSKPRSNPASAAADAFEEFHGHPSTELLTVKQKVHHHTHLAAAGKLKALRVKPINHGPLRTIKGLGSAVLAFNEAKNQLFVRGGDQSMDKAELKRFGISQVHELETLGRLTGIDYHTNKTHLGDEGGEATYDHGFRMTNENGKHVVVSIARYPDLIYRVLDEQFEFSGGSYTILAEGIDR